MFIIDILIYCFTNVPQDEKSITYIKISSKLFRIIKIILIKRKCICNEGIEVLTLYFIKYLSFNIHKLKND